MISFIQFLYEMVNQIDISSITSIYPNTAVSLQLVQKYNKSLLAGIIAITDLKTNAYGETEQGSEGVIRVNVNKIIDKFKNDDKKIVLEIACTILHECIHKIERRNLGITSEKNVRDEEQKFLKWAKYNYNQIN